MTAPWNGLPINPEKSGLHWLGRQHSFVMGNWIASRKLWNIEGRLSDASYALGHFTYLRPCPTPAELDAMEKEREGLRTTLKACEDQFRFYAEEHTKGGKAEKAATNWRFVGHIRAALSEGEG